MRKNKRNLLFVAVCLSICLCTVLNKGLMGLGIISQRHNSNLEGREYARRPQATVASIADGTFQDSFEQYVSDGVPMRDAMMLANAAVQRSGIALASRLFGYPVYPTFFGSSYIYAPEYDAILPIALKASDQEVVYAQAHNTLAAFATRHPELEVYVLEVDNPANSSANPTYDLVSDAAGTADMRDSLRNGLPRNVTMVGHDCPDASYLTSAYYRTDHHWMTGEAYQSYTEALAKMLPGADPVAYEEHIFDCAFLGSTARAGLMFPVEPVPLVDYRIDMSSFEIAIDGNPVGEEALDSWGRYARGEQGDGRLNNRYADYYHSDFAFLEIHNALAKSDGGLLIVGNSYTNCMERFFAANYAHVYKIDERYTSLLADDFLAGHPEVRQVLIVGQVGPILQGALAPA